MYPSFSLTTINSRPENHSPRAFLQAAALLQSGALGMAQPGAYMQQRLPQRMEPPLGGRLARRPMDPQAEAERRAQQDKLFSLDIGRIRAGEREGQASWCSYTASS